MPTHTDLSDDVGFVDVSAVAPSIQTALLLQVSEVDVPPRDVPLSRQVSDLIQSVSTALTWHLSTAHHREGNDGLSPLLSQVHVRNETAVWWNCPDKHNVKPIESG